MPVEDQQQLDQLETAQNKAAAQAGLAPSHSAFPSYTIPGPLPQESIDVFQQPSPAQALEVIEHHMNLVAGWSRQLLSSFEQAPPPPPEVLPSHVEWPYLPEDFSGPLLSSVPRRITRKQVFILNLFCGQRRQGDIQQAVELDLEVNLIDIEIRVLSIDIVIDSQLGDLTRPGTVEVWAAHIRAGRVQLVGGGLPAKPSRQLGGEREAPHH